MTAHGHGPDFQMSIGADRRDVATVTAAFAAFAERNGLPPAVRRDLLVALDELLANCVSHGLAGRSDGEVRVEASVADDRLRVTLSDNGRPFDPLARPAPDTTLSVEERPIGGLGIHLVRQLMDTVRYQRIGDRNVIELVKHLTPS